MNRPSLRTLPLVALALAAAACSDVSGPDAKTPEPTPSGPTPLAVVSCNANVQNGTVSCGSPNTGGVNAAVLVGGQHLYVDLTSSGIAVTADTFAFDATITNLIPQPMGTTDFNTANPNGIRVFFLNGPTASGGSGAVTVANADGTGTFTAAGQPYFQYSGALLGADGVLGCAETSSTRNWVLNLNGATSFTFVVYISTPMPAELGVLRWNLDLRVSSFAVRSLSGTSATDVYASGEFDPFDMMLPCGGHGRVWHYDGGLWQTVAMGSSGSVMTGVWASPTGAFAVGNQEVLEISQFGGSYGASRTPVLAQLQDVWGASATNVFAVGLLGEVLRYNGSAWTTSRPASNGNAALYGVWGTSGSDVFAVGDGGAILHYNGASWSPMTSPVTDDLKAVWGTSPSNVYAVGLGGRVLHYNGSAWTVVTQFPGRLYDVWGTSATDVYASGDLNAVFHYNGAGWYPMCTSGPGGELYAGWSAAPDKGFVGGSLGVIGYGVR
ncbi:MAG TPA: hypothetical protein VFQ39_03205 [Longimicrobium sp.]|nr:hypothetical protein [Longimicrobium sp.]